MKCVHDCGWHFILHSCGKVNAFVPCFIDLKMDVLNLQTTADLRHRGLGGRPRARSEQYVLEPGQQGAAESKIRDVGPVPD